MSAMLIDDIEKIERNFLTPKEAAAAMGISVATFYRNYETMNIPFYKTGKKINIPKEKFIDFLRCGDIKN